MNGLHPFIDSQQGILRLSSRLGLSELPYDKKYPIILPLSPHVVALIRGVHLENNHSEVGATVAIILQRIWIPGLKGLAVKLTTVLTEIEHCINSRPLTYISDNPEYDVITPEGFLIIKAAISIEQGSKAHPYHALSQAQGTILEHFWQVWRNEYLTNLPSNLKNSHSHRNIEQGQVVLVREDFDKRMACPMGVIVNVRESSDNIVRSATVKMGDKTYDRPIQRLYELEGFQLIQSLKPQLSRLKHWAIQFHRAEKNTLMRWARGRRERVIWAAELT